MSVRASRWCSRRSASAGIPFTLLVMLLACAALQLSRQPLPAGAESSRLWTFDAAAPGTLPDEFVVGTLFDARRAGEWTVINPKRLPAALEGLDRREATRVRKLLAAVEPPSPPHVLAQVRETGFEHDYKVVLVQGTTARDLVLEVAFLSVAGKGDMGGGLMWRARDDRNYYLTRANPLEQNIRLYHVVDGVRTKLANVNRIISVDRWHTLRVEARGPHFQVFYDGERVLEVRDHTFGDGGLIGLWTKADAVTAFDNLTLTALE